jgi:tRNA G18 (ribose-2'-O)-methylase SpoU
MEAVSISSADDPRLADYVSLTDISLRTSLEAEHGLFIAEGAKVIARAVAAGYPVRSVLLAESRRGDLPSLLPPAAEGSATGGPGTGRPGTGGSGTGGSASLAGPPVYLVPDEAVRELTGFRVHRGALAAMERKPLPDVAATVAGARRIAVLEDLVDHGNVGAIFRCAAALGVDAVVLSPRCADPLYRRAVKVSMGAVFAIRYARMADWFGGLAGLRDAGFRLLALTPDEQAAPLGEALATAGARDRVALLLGTEGDGLSSRWLHEADEAVRIPMDPAVRAAGVDSLNVVAAAAIACHTLSSSI